ncbi:hypothetical protein [Paenibacillus woosongensis]|uniref:hypothetical protein n=1 Tax=Paenibacillus woosongensis TaxID=307580 RepID=UPI0018C327BB|nr:hypothetical protein [Paenibacillus woosongensis]
MNIILPFEKRFAKYSIISSIVPWNYIEVTRQLKFLSEKSQYLLLLIHIKNREKLIETVGVVENEHIGDDPPAEAAQAADERRAELDV